MQKPTCSMKMQSFRLCLVAVLLAVVPLSALCQDYTSSNKKAIKEFEKGQAALYQGKTSAAVKCFEEAVKLDPSFCEANIILAEWYMDAGNKPLAKQYYYAVVNSNAEFFTPAWLQLGDMELAEGNNEKAHSHYQTFLRLDKEHQEVVSRGVCKDSLPFATADIGMQFAMFVLPI